ncbi:RNA polymerase sigma factor [Paraburkholderia acidisoli]|uniref:RNA polymerase sigma factor n=1 Tax=Paraburkholderia acidisoli TaxID=2571748 RepID=A0A7Z2GGZ2_9BURK|nr:RNA polymerase sigma factor [Paraburkholderia acidisoli]QGZ61616.1 RNA polymerase sigma factor [Paraburkholderia acidisoli]
MGESAYQQGDGARAHDDASHAAGDEAARSRRFQALALPHLDAAYNLARWLSRNPGDAEDIVQEAFLRAFRFFDAFRGDAARPWLLAIVRRVWYDEWRRRAGAEEVAPFDELRDDAPLEGWETGGVDPETLAIRAENARHVQDALLRLPVEYREVLVLRELEDLEYREIAAIADVPIGTVMSRLARGRRRLAALLAPHSGSRNVPRARFPAEAPGNAQVGAQVGAPVNEAKPCNTIRTPRRADDAELGASNEAWRPSGRDSPRQDVRFRETPDSDGGGGGGGGLGQPPPVPPPAEPIPSSKTSPIRRVHVAGGSHRNAGANTEAPDEL